MIFRLFLVTTLATGSVVFGQQPAQKADEAAARARVEEQKARTAAKQAFQHRMTEIENRLAQWKQDAKPTTDKMRREWDRQKAEMERELKKLRGQLSGVDDKSTDVWNRVKASTESALRDMEKKIDEWRSSDKEPSEKKK